VKRIPFMILSDSPASTTGLGKIARDLALRIHHNIPELEVGTCGLGKVTSSALPFRQYVLPGLTANMTPPNLPEIWNDFSGGRRGIFFTIWNPGWLPWLANPTACKNIDAELRQFLEAKPFERWGYFPIDAYGPNGKLPLEIASIINGFDRKLAYTKWAADLIDNTNGNLLGTTEHLPHGIDTGVYFPRNKVDARRYFLWTVGTGIDKPFHDPNIFLVGCVGTNSQRKDWGLTFQICQELMKRDVNVGLWAHTDSFQKYWNFQTMQIDYGLGGRLIPTATKINDENMAWAYSACDVTIAHGLGEGFGYCIAESLATGVPCIHGNYAGGAEFLPPECKVDPIGFYNEGFYAHQRPVFNIGDWADKIMAAAGTQATLPAELDWNNLWPRFESWLKAGL
jgi:glycosyltransferase involved in cell wall biosynthesis